MLTYHPQAGEDILHACEGAITLAKARGQRVRFTFNAVDVEAGPDDHPKALAYDYDQTCQRRSEEYRNSPQGKAAAELDRQNRLSHQKRTDALIGELPSVVADAATLIPWLVRLSYAADRVGINWDYKRVVAVIEKAGWLLGDATGRPPKDYVANRGLAARYLIGQALDFINRGFAPHGIIQLHARDFGFCREDGSPL